MRLRELVLVAFTGTDWAPRQNLIKGGTKPQRNPNYEAITSELFQFCHQPQFTGKGGSLWKYLALSPFLKSNSFSQLTGDPKQGPEVFRLASPNWSYLPE